MFQKTAILLAGLALLAASGGIRANELPIPEDIYGSYAPGGDCGRQPRVHVDGKGVFLDTSAGRAGPLPVSVCMSCAGGARYEGIQRWVYVKYGKNKWGDNMPVILMFNAREQQGRLDVEFDNTLKTPIGAPMTEAVRAKTLGSCGARAGAAVPAQAGGAGPSSGAPAQAQAMSPAAAMLAAGSPVAGSPAAGSSTAGSPAAGSPAASFAAAIAGLMKPASLPQGSYYDWRQIESAPHARWAELPPDMLDRPLPDGSHFRRNGAIAAGGQTVKAMAAGARAMVMNLYFRNEGAPLGEPALRAALGAEGVAASLARCPADGDPQAPRWYRLSAAGKRSAYLGVLPARGAAQPWEGFHLSLDEGLPPMTPPERAFYTDRCPRG